MIEYQTLAVNHWEGRNGYKPCAIVLHRAQGDKNSVIGWFKNESAQASAHYLVCKDGVTVEFVSPDNTAWANGWDTSAALPNPDYTNPLIREWRDRNINPNYVTISIEHEGYITEQLTDAQLNASVSLVRDLCTKYNIPNDRDHIIGHYQIDSVTRQYCPNFDASVWTRYTSQEPFIDALTHISIDNAFLAFWQRGGGVNAFGHPLQLAVTGKDNVLRQLFENVLIEKYPNGTVRLGGLGQRFLVQHGQI